MKNAVGFFFLLQLCGTVLISHMFWSQPARSSPDRYAQMAAMFVGVPVLIVATLALGLIYKWREALPEQSRDKILLVSPAMVVTTVVATVSGFLGVGFG